MNERLTLALSSVNEAAMSELSSKEKAAFRNKAQRLKPAILVGKKGITRPLITEMDKALATDKLVKVAFKADREGIAALVEELGSKTHSQCVGGVGKRRIFYKENSEEA
jgi:putative YhbY family RNA-binding protein|tara:strand:- start:1 stop:327 length:327 start_codon:yes stop_codon:yes gene_type:complete